MANDVNELLVLINKNDFDKWWEMAAEEEVPIKAQSWKYSFSYDGKRLPVKYVIESLAKSINYPLTRSDFGSSDKVRASFADKFNLRIIEELKYDKSEKQKLLIYLNKISNKGLFENWLSYCNSIINTIEIDPYHIRMSIGKDNLSRLELGNRVITSLKVNPTGVYNIYLFLEKGEIPNLGLDIKKFEEFRGNDGKGVYNLSVSKWSEISKDLLVANRSAIANEYQQVRNSNLSDIRRNSANTNPALKYIIYKGLSIDEFETLENSSEVMDKKIEILPVKDHALNTILFGPPGTGKTYNTIDLAVEIIQGNNGSHTENKLLFDKLSKEGQIQFMTFHQSLGYEDFIEGIKPVTKDGRVTYDIKDGIFKKIAKAASSNLKAFRTKVNRLPFEEALELLTADLKESETDALEIPMAKKGYSYKITEINDNSIPFIKQSGGSHHSLSIKTLESFYLEERDSIKGLQPYYLPLRDFLWKYSENTEIKKTELKRFVLVIDEINRGNVSQIFGELITLIEHDKREGADNEISVVLPYSKESFSVPSNLYIIGTMNTADRSVEALDTALRRRFSFVEMPPLPELLNPYNLLGNAWATHWIEENTKAYWANWAKVESEILELPKLIINEAKYLELSQNWKTNQLDQWKNLTDYETVFEDCFTTGERGIRLDDLLRIINSRIEKLLNKDHQIGHAYLMDVMSEDDLRLTFKDKIIPLLQEYFFGDYGKIGLVLGNSFIRADIEFEGFADYKYQDESVMADLKERKVYSIAPSEEWDFQSILASKK
jgi:hypothetical protein